MKNNVIALLCIATLMHNAYGSAGYGQKAKARVTALQNWNNNKILAATSRMKVPKENKLKAGYVTEVLAAGLLGFSGYKAYQNSWATRGLNNVKAATNSEIAQTVLNALKTDRRVQLALGSVGLVGVVGGVVYVAYKRLVAKRIIELNAQLDALNKDLATQVFSSTYRGQMEAQKQVILTKLAQYGTVVEESSSSSSASSATGCGAGQQGDAESDLLRQ